MKFVVEKLDAKDIPTVSRLHKMSISTGFLATLPNIFLNELYKAISEDPGSSVFIIRSVEAGDLAGFIAGTKSTKKLFIRIILSKGLLLFWLILPSFFSRINNLIKSIETLTYPFFKKKVKKTEISNVPAELLSIVVKEEYRGLDLGKLLLENLEIFLRDKKTNVYKVVTSEKSNHSNKFYLKNGFVKVASIRHHSNSLNIYIKNINYPNHRSGEK